MSAKYADHCQVNVLGRSEQGRDLYELVIGDPDSDNVLIVTASIHDDVWQIRLVVRLCILFYYIFLPAV